MKTVILSSAHAVGGGLPTDCQVEIKDGLLDSFKKYKARLRWFKYNPEGLLVANVKVVYLVIDGLTVQDVYTSIPNITPFAALNLGDFQSALVTWPLLCEPRDHSRIVTVSNNILRIRLVNHDFTTLVGSVSQHWTMEIQFDEL